MYSESQYLFLDTVYDFNHSAGSISDSLLGDNVMGFNQREAKLAQRVREVEDQNQMLRHQLGYAN